MYISTIALSSYAWGGIREVGWYNDIHYVFAMHTGLHSSKGLWQTAHCLSIFTVITLHHYIIATPRKCRVHPNISFNIKLWSHNNLFGDYYIDLLKSTHTLSPNIAMHKNHKTLKWNALKLIQIIRIKKIWRI